MSSRARKLTAAVVAVVLVVGLAVTAVVELTKSSNSGPAQCRVAIGPSSFVLQVDQATNATTIAAVGMRLGMPDHAVTVAVATALQESGLHNLDHGDRDSLGLFQQRPSQGWGTADEILTPTYAARVFYEHLARVPGWETMAVTDAAQHVQRSGAPQAYAQWEAEARAIARATTGEVAAGLACRNETPSTGTTVGAVNAVLTAELGAPALGTTLADRADGPSPVGSSGTRCSSGSCPSASRVRDGRRRPGVGRPGRRRPPRCESSSRAPRRSW